MEKEFTILEIGKVRLETLPANKGINKTPIEFTVYDGDEKRSTIWPLDIIEAVIEFQNTLKEYRSLRTDVNDFSVDSSKIRGYFSLTHDGSYNILFEKFCPNEHLGKILEFCQEVKKQHRERITEIMIEKEKKRTRILMSRHEAGIKYDQLMERHPILMGKIHLKPVEM